MAFLKEINLILLFLISCIVLIVVSAYSTLNLNANYVMSYYTLVYFPTQTVLNLIPSDANDLRELMTHQTNNTTTGNEMNFQVYQQSSSRQRKFKYIQTIVYHTCKLYDISGCLH